MMDPLAGGMRDGGFGASPNAAGGFGGGSFGGASFGGDPAAQQGYGGAGYGGGAPYGSPYGGSPYGAGGNGAYDPNGGQANGGYGGYGGDLAQRGASDPNNPYGAGNPYGGQYGGQAGDGSNPYGANGGYGNSPYGNANGAYPGSPSGAAPRYGALQYDRSRGAFVYVPMENRWSVWSTAYGAYNVAQGDANTGSHDTTVRSGGMIAGLDYKFGNGGVLGVALTAGATSWGLSGGLGGGKSDVMQIGAYGSQRFGDAYVSGAFAAGWHKMTTDRTIAIGGSDELRGSFSAQTTGGRAETGFRFAFEDYGLTPHVAAQTLSYRAPGYSETVAAGQNDFALNVGSRKTTQTRFEGGVWLDRTQTYGTASILYRGRIAWVHEWMDAPSVASSLQSLPGSGFTVIGAGQSPDRALVSAGAEYKMANGVSVGAKVDGEFSRTVQNITGTATARYQW